MSNFISNNLDNDLIPWQFDGSVNNSFSSNNQSSINASSSQSCNLSTNFSVNNGTNFNHQTNLTPLTSNHLNSNCYYEYPATFNSSSNSSIALSTNEFDIYNQQNLVTNDSNLIPSFYQTFGQDVNKETNPNSIMINNSPAAHHLINPSFNQAINSTTNHYFNSQQQPNYRLNSNVQHDNQFLSTSVNHERNLFFNHNIKENIKIEHDLVDDDQRDVKRQTNNERERERVRKLNKGFEELKRTCNTVMPSTSNQKMTKLHVLEKAFKAINQLEEEVNQKLLGSTNPRSNQ